MERESRGAGRGRFSAAQRLFIATVVAALLIPAAALAAFPGTDPAESPRLDTPNDPGFDRCEPDDEQGQSCTNVFGQEVERFGFAPSGSQNTALYNPAALPARQSAQNIAAGRNPLGQVSGISADVAYKYFGEDDPDGLIGDPEVEIAILDTGIRWNRGELRKKIALNEEELPEPQDGGGSPCGADDCNGDGAFDVDDFADDPRVDMTAGHDEADGILDASDLLATFSDGTDDDGNGFVDDIAGWDFFDDDNDAYDASSYSAASNHGSGRAEEAGSETDNGSGGTGVCPACQIVPIRVWDTFVLDTNQFALGTMYAADNEIEIVEGAVGGLLNSRFARETIEYAYDQGTLPVIVSSDLNTANHNYPTNYDHTLHIQGTVADVHGAGEELPEVPECPDELGPLQCEAFRQPFIDLLATLTGTGLFGTNVPVGTWFRNSGTTQYGGHAHLVTVAPTGSAATGQAAGAAGLIKSFGNRMGLDLGPNEIKQLMTGTAEDVRALNTIGVGTPDPAQDGWDQHFGFGRLDLGAAVEAVRDDEVPPEVLITGPDWFAPLDVTEQSSVDVRAEISAERAGLDGGSRYDWELQWAPGIEPCEADFETVGTGSGADPTDAVIGSVDLTAVRAALDGRTLSSSCGNVPGPVTGGGTVDPTVPVPGPGDVDPNEPAFTIRVVATDTDGNRGVDRKVLFAYADETLHEGWSKPIGGVKDLSGEAEGGGESSHRFYDLDGDNLLEIIEASSSGTLSVFRHDGTPDPSFNDGEPVVTEQYFNVHGDAPGFGPVAPPNEPLRIPAIGDIDGDRLPEIVDSAGHRVYAWEADGESVEGFPVEIDPANSQTADISRENHVKRGFLASPALGDLDGDGDLEIAIAGLDQHLYVYEGDGSDRPGFPVYLRPREEGGEPVPCSGDFECAESINTPAIGDIDGDGVADIVVPTNEFDDNPSAPGAPATLGGLSGVITNFLAQALGGSSRVYAVDADGEFLEGWPITVDGILPDVLPFVGPGVDHVLANLDDDPELEVIGNAASGDVRATDGDGTAIVGYDSQPVTGEHVDKTKVVNLFENPVVADLAGNGDLTVMKGGMTLIGIVNLGVTVGQNLPYNHVLQGWNAEDGTSLPAFPQAVEDYQLLSSPAVSDVSDAPGNEAIVGTGLYLIRNINSTGVEGSGWPKFTGGWNFAVPAVGDVDGDGKLEVSAQTREGFSFLWDTEGDACGPGAAEWRTSRHDEWNTGAYDTDSRPPGTPTDLTVDVRSGGIDFSWTAPGDDWLCGEADSYEIRISDEPITGPADGERVERLRVRKAAGDTETTGIPAADVRGNRYLAVLYRDDAGNWGRIASTELPGRCESQVTGTGGNDSLAGTFYSERIRGLSGNDSIRAGGDEDCIAGGSGNDTVRGAGGDDVVKGQAGNDKLNGGGGADRIRGNKGRDVARGGAGADDIRTGGDRDKVFAGGGNDRINVRGGGVDRVECGKGQDVVKAGRKDKVRKDCEKVQIKGK